MAGWPWPLDGVQAWFEDLWTWIGDAARSAVSVVSGWVNDAAAWLWSRITEVGGWLWERFQEIGAGLSKLLSDAGAALLKNLSDLAGSLSQGITGFFSWIWDQLTRIGQWITGVIWGWVDGSLRWLTDTFRWLQGVISDTASWIVDQLSGMGDFVVSEVRTMFDGAFAGIAEVFRDWPTKLWEAFTTPFLGAFDTLVGYMGGVKSASSPERFVMEKRPVWWEGWPACIISDGLAGAFKRDELSGETFLDKAKHAYGLSSPEWVEDLTKVSKDYFGRIDKEYVQKLIAPPTGSSPITGEEAIRWGTGIVSTAVGLAAAIWTAHIIAEAGSLGQLDGVNELYHNLMSATGLAAISAAFLHVPLEVGILTPTRQFYNEVFRTTLPGPTDLIRFVVREVITPDRFSKVMPLHGYSDEWTKAYWEAHWILPAFDNVVDARHRGLISEEELEKFLIWHDYSPKPRPGIEKTDVEIMRGLLKTLIPRVDLRYAWELGRLTDDELVAWYERLGYEEDSELMAEIQMARSLVEEMHKVRDEWIRDYVDGFIDEDVLRANLAEIGIGPRRIDYYVIYAAKRRDRERLRDLLDLYRDGYMKDLITEEELRDRVMEIIIIPEVADLFVEKAHVDKYKKPKPPTETTEDKALKELQKYQITYAIQAYRRYAIEKDELVTLLIEADVDPAVARTRADYEELKRPIPKPPADVVAAEKEKARIQKLEEAKAIEEYRADLIDEGTLLKRLLEIGYSEALATAITQLEIIRKM